jgi:curved DNA-binding protein CbpA
MPPPPGTPERRKPRRSPRNQSLDLRVQYNDANGSEASVLSSLIDWGEGGIGIQTRVPIPPGTSVKLILSDQMLQTTGQMPESARVCWSRPAYGGVFRIGLAYEFTRRRIEEEPPDSAAFEAPPVDYYEILQIHQKADPDTIHRVYRVLAQRYHPDNQDTGSADLFRMITRAYEVLSDPQQRASYDLQHSNAQRARWRIFNNTDSSRGVAAEKRKRQAILAALYQKRVQDPHNPELSVFDFEDLLGVPREHLEFTIWYLKERGFLGRSDNNKFVISVSGVEQIEEMEGQSLPGERLLPAPASESSSSTGESSTAD